MRARAVVALIVAAPLLVLGGCGDDDGGSKANGGDSVTEIESEAGSGASESDTTDPGSETDSTTPEVSVPDLDVLGDSDCAKATQAWIAMLGAATGAGNSDELEQYIDDLETELPDEYQEDITILAQAYRTFMQEGMIDGAAALSTEEVTQASEDISAYFEEVCDFSS